MDVIILYSERGHVSCLLFHPFPLTEVRLTNHQMFLHQWCANKFIHALWSFFSIPGTQALRLIRFAERWLSCADVWRGSVIDVNHAGHSARAFHPDAHRWLATVTWIQPKGMLWVTLADGQSQSRISCLKAILNTFLHLFTHSFSVSLPPFLRHPPSFCLSVWWLI